MQALWNQQHQLHPAFDRLNRCLAEDWFLLKSELQLQGAHATTLCEAGILSPLEKATILEALRLMWQQWLGQPCPDSDAEDIHTWIETELTILVGEAGKRIHTARSRNDQVATLIKLYLMDAAVASGDKLGQQVALMARRAQEWSDAEFPLQTHAQFAAPGNVGFWMLRYAVAVDRVRRKLAGLKAEWRSECPLGSAAVAGSSIAIDRQTQASELGFDAPSLNALYSTTTRDECLDFLALVSQLALHYQSLATDLIGFTQTSMRWTVYPHAFATGSSMMPNKSNPDALELLRGECNGLLSAYQQVVLTLKGLPSGYNRDLQCIKPVLHQAVLTLENVTELVTAFLQHIDFDRDRLSAALAQGDIGATLDMEAMVVSGVALRDAHHSRAVGSVDPSLAPMRHCDEYKTIGSASPEETRRVAAQILEQLSVPLAP